VSDPRPMTEQEAIDWVLHLDTPPRPTPSAWTDIAWCDYWRGKRHNVAGILTRAAATHAARENALTGNDYQLLASILADHAYDAEESAEEDVRAEAPMLHALARKLGRLAPRKLYEPAQHRAELSAETQLAATHAAIRALPRYHLFREGLNTSMSPYLTGSWVKWSDVASLLGNEKP